MKYLILLMLLIGCTKVESHQFKVGDCFIWQGQYDPEVWDQDKIYIHKVVAIGHHHYGHIIFSKFRHEFLTNDIDSAPFYNEHNMKLVKCPDSH